MASVVHQRASQRGLLWCPASPPCSASRDSSEERRWRRLRRFRRVCRGLDGSHASSVLSEASISQAPRLLMWSTVLRARRELRAP